MVQTGNAPLYRAGIRGPFERTGETRSRPRPSRRKRTGEKRSRKNRRRQKGSEKEPLHFEAPENEPANVAASEAEPQEAAFPSFSEAVEEKAAAGPDKAAAEAVQEPENVLSESLAQAEAENSLLQHQEEKKN